MGWLVSLCGFLGLVLWFLGLNIEDLSGSRVYADLFCVLGSRLDDIDGPELRAICRLEFGSSDFASLDFGQGNLFCLFFCYLPVFDPDLFRRQRRHRYHRGERDDQQRYRTKGFQPDFNPRKADPPCSRKN